MSRSTGVNLARRGALTRFDARCQNTRAHTTRNRISSIALLLSLFPGLGLIGIRSIASYGRRTLRQRRSFLDTKLRRIRRLSCRGRSLRFGSTTIDVSRSAMLGKRTRGNGAQDPQQQAKRPLMSLIAGSSTKPGGLAPLSSKRTAVAAAESPSMQRTLSQKENVAVRTPAAPLVEYDLFMADANGARAQQVSVAYSQCLFQLQLASDCVFSDLPALLAALSPPPIAPREAAQEPLAVSTPTSRSIPHIYAHAASLLSTSSDLASSLPLSGRADQRETLLAFLQRRFPVAYTPRDGPSTPTSRPGPASMYVSGPPGIGKTALLSSVLGDFERQLDERDLRSEICVSMENCATLAAGGLGGDKAWDRLAAGLQIDIDETASGQAALTPKQRFEAGLQDGRR